MSDCSCQQERKRLFLMSYDELLYLLNKYPKPNPYHCELPTSMDQCTQTYSSYLNSSPLRKSSSISTVSSTSPTVIMSPSPDTKKKRYCNISDIHESAKKVSNLLLNDLPKTPQKNNKNRKRSFQQLTASLSQCSIDCSNDDIKYPLKKRRKISVNKLKRKELLIKHYEIPTVTVQKSNNNQNTHSNNLESIESVSPPPINQIFQQKITTKKAKKVKKVHKQSATAKQNKNKLKNKKRRRSSLTLSKLDNKHVINNEDATFFGILPELDECEQKQMSNNEIIRFENKLNDNNTIEEEWRLKNESIPDADGDGDAGMNIITAQNKYTPLWRSSVNLPEIEKNDNKNKLRVLYDPHPVDKYSKKYLNSSQDVSPKTKWMQNSLESVNNNSKHTRSQIIEKYQNNVTCFNNIHVDVDDIESDSELDSSENSNKASLFDNTDFSEQTKINSLLENTNNSNNLNTENMERFEKFKNKKKKRTYADLPFPQID